MAFTTHPAKSFQLMMTMFVKVHFLVLSLDLVLNIFVSSGYFILIHLEKLSCAGLIIFLHYKFVCFNQLAPGSPVSKGRQVQFLQSFCVGRVF